ncbi:MAG: glycosyltransferase family 4 protein [Prevotellaceae bacterium]|nr:glycosyltransferase family 4 protein [Candidatus Colivivens caballi]
MINEKKSVFIVGAFGYCNNQLDGQTIKTRNILKLMQVKYQGTVSFFDTLSTRKHPLGIFKLFSGLIHCHTLLLVPCRGNLAYFLPVAYCLSKLFRYEIIVICVGGWQIEYFTGKQGYRAHKLAMQCCKNIKAHLPEMLSVHNELTTHYGFRNSEVFPNFRFFYQAPVTENSGTLRLVYLARIRTEKGYASIFKALDILKAKNIDVSIDFYGQIYDRDKKDFMSLISSHKDNAHYCEAIDPKHINERLRHYDVMLLPTQYYTEGFPGTILDAYISGIPVIVTEWKYSHEFVNDGITGYIVPFENCTEPLAQKIEYINQHRDTLQLMKNNAQEEAKKYSDDAAWAVLSKYL